MWYVQFPIIILLNEFHIPNLTYFLSKIMQEFSARCFTIKNALPWFLSSLVSMMLRVPLPSKCWFNLKMRKSSCHQCKTCPWALVHSSGGTGSETPSSDKNDHDPTRRPLNHYPPKKSRALSQRVNVNENHSMVKLHELFWGLWVSYFERWEGVLLLR